MKRLNPFLFLLLLLPSIVLAEWKKELVWPMGTYSPTGNFFDDIGTGFGPMNSGGEWFNPGVNIHLTGSVKVAYPADTVNSNTHVARVKNLRVHTDSGWVLLEAIKPDHEARLILYYFVTVNGSDIHIGDTFAGGVTLPGVTVTSPRHLRFSVFSEKVVDAESKLYRTTVNPYRFLPYPSSECSNNVYTGSLSSDADGNYFQLEAQETRKCRILDQIQLNFISDTIVSDRVIALGGRLGRILRDLATSSGNKGGTSWSGYENVYYSGTKIDADAPSGNMTTTRYRIYYRPAQTNSGKYAYTLKDVHGKIFSWKAKTNSAGCSGCNPNAPLFAGLTEVAYSTGNPGMRWGINRLSGADAYVLFLTDGLSVGYDNHIKYGDQIGFVLDTASVNHWFSPILPTDPTSGRAGAQYRYGAASVDGNDIGCIGPFYNSGLNGVVQNCNHTGSACFDQCLHYDPSINFVQAPMPTSGLIISYQDTSVMRLTSSGIMWLKGRRLSVAAGGFLFKKDTSTILNIKNTSLTTGGVTYIGAGFGAPADQVYSTIPLEGLKFQSSDRAFYLTDYGKIGFDSTGHLQEIVNLNQVPVN